MQATDSSSLTTIIVALLGLISMIITVFGGAVIYFAKWFSTHYGEDMKAHTQAANSQAEANLGLKEAVEKNTASNVALNNTVTIVGKNSEEQYTFMKNLNGKLAKATIQTVQEQTVEHQTINHVDES